jgi:hypothetical protein
MMFLPARPGTAERGRAEVGSAHQPGRLGLVERHDILLDSRFLIGCPTIRFGGHLRLNGRSSLKPPDNRRSQEAAVCCIHSA